MAHPFFWGYLFALEDDVFFAEGEFIHQDEVKADADAEDIAFLVVKILLVEIQIRESFKILLFDHQISIFTGLGRILLLGVDPLNSCKRLLEASDLELQSPSNENIVNMNEIPDFSLMEVLHDRAHLGHDMQFGGEADCLFVPVEVLP